MSVAGQESQDLLATQDMEQLWAEAYSVLILR